MNCWLVGHWTAKRDKEWVVQNILFDAKTLVGTKVASSLLLINKEKILMSPYFVYAPPDFDDGFYPYRLPNPPYPNAEKWKCSVYYYWWLYLRRNANYQLTCEQGGRGPCAELYRDFGNIYEGDFRSWWQEHWKLFAEPIAVTSSDDVHTVFERSITIRIDLDAKRSRVLDDVRNILAEQQADLDQDRIASSATYPVETNPVLSALHQHLAVWDMKGLNPWVSDAVLADLSNIRVNHVVNGLTAQQAEMTGRDPVRIISEVKRRKVQALQRHLRVAEQHIKYAGLGRFPHRVGR